MVIPAEVQNIDIAILTDVVRCAQHDDTFEISDWTVEPISHEAIIGTTGGLFHFHGQGRRSDSSGNQSWSVALKAINKPSSGCLNPRDWCYWKREMLVYESALLRNLPGGIAAPRYYGSTEHESGGWLWMEHIVETVPRQWTLEEFHRTARQMGRFGGSFLTGVPLPDDPWLTSFFRSLHGDGSGWSDRMNPEMPKNVWQDALVQQTFSTAHHNGVLRIWAEKHRFFDILDRLPQVLCHNDLHRRNLMLCRETEQTERLVVLDWTFCGCGAIGADMGELIAGDLYLFEVDPAMAANLEHVVMDAYLAGLRETGWVGDVRVVRLGYLLSTVLWYGATLPGWVAIMLSGDWKVNTMAMYGQPEDVVLSGWVKLTEFLLERADEARSLIRTLGLD